MATPPALWSDVAARSIATWPGAGAGVLRFSLAAHDGRRPRGVGAGRPFDVARLETPDVAAANAGAHSSVFGCQIEIRKLPSGSVGPALARRSRPSERSLRASAMTDADIRTSPGRELGSMAAALVTPSPLILSPSTRISPTLTPTQNAMRLSVGRFGCAWRYRPGLAWRSVPLVPHLGIRRSTCARPFPPGAHRYQR